MKGNKSPFVSFSCFFISRYLSEGLYSFVSCRSAAQNCHPALDWHPVTIEKSRFAHGIFRHLKLATKRKKEKQQDSCSKIKVCFPCDGGLFSGETCVGLRKSTTFHNLINSAETYKRFIVCNTSFSFSSKCFHHMHQWKAQGLKISTHQKTVRVKLKAEGLRTSTLRKSARAKLNRGLRLRPSKNMWGRS